jgi:hypothetical protein
MSIRLLLSGVMLACATPAWADTSDELLKETARMVKETTAALAGVKDADGARAVRPNLDRMSEHMKKVMKEVPSLTKEAGDDKAKQTRKAWEGLAPSFQALQKQVLRLDTDPKTHKELRDQSMVAQMRRVMEQRARIVVEALSTQVEAYKLNNNAYPDSIESLAHPQPTGGAALIPPGKVRDPWGQLYKLDPAGKKNKGIKCDVWSPGHPVEKRPIGNWVEEKGPAKGQKDGKG